MTEFTPISSFTGGVLIGISAVMLMWTCGRIAGVSGILSGLLPPVERSSILFRLCFLSGLVLAPLIYQAMTKSTIVQTISDNTLLLSTAGLLVGIGSVVGSGCTSGHGVCGISRLSLRSVIATLVFMSSGVATVAILRHLMGG